MSWRLAKSLEKLREQVDEIAPKRSKISDGSIGDADHANRSSDHNPWCGPGVVTAIDITHDPDGGVDCDQLIDALVESKDPRIKYVIWNGRIWRSYKTSSSHPPAWIPEAYTGPNPHTKHMHISVNCDASKDSTRAWSIEGREWFEMATKAQLREVVREEVAKSEKRLKAQMRKERKLLAVGKTQKGYNPDRVNLKKAIEVSK